MPSPWMLLLDEPSEGIQPSIVQEIGADPRRACAQSTGLSHDRRRAEPRPGARRGDAHRACSSADASRADAATPVQCAAARSPTLLGLGAARMTRGDRERGRARARPRPRHRSRARRPPAHRRRAASGADSGSRVAHRDRPHRRAAERHHRHGDHHGNRQAPDPRTDEGDRRFAAHEHVGARDRRVPGGAWRARCRPTTASTQLPDYLPPVRYPRTPGYRPGAAENPLNAWAVKSEVRGAPLRPARRQARRAQGQRLPRRRADDERRLDARRLRARRRRHRRHAHPRCRRHHRRQGALRILLPVRRQPHLRDRSGAQPVQVRLLGRRLVVGLRARWSAPARSRWRSAATRAARSACRRAGAAATA